MNMSTVASLGGAGDEFPDASRTAARAPKKVRSLPAPAYRPLSIELLRTVDVFTAGAVLVAVFIAVNSDTLSSAGADFLLLRVSVKNLLLLCGFVALWQFLFMLAGLYDQRVIRRRRREF